MDCWKTEIYCICQDKKQKVVHQNQLVLWSQVFERDVQNCGGGSVTIRSYDNAEMIPQAIGLFTCEDFATGHWRAHWLPNVNQSAVDATQKF